ncbi:class I SAM-dependent methyltransferase [Rasiella rasia]|uniref:Class I SAM-dependent methyltransferase n=1 Tax=Rasiella rasia TaxID=2744027 RepID=A0A6G6GIX7_9FLAO|nr:class I SAM-dependent methyltransferase [Rasiella rasia]QIE58477.1 class I SAM-dependent methyltransferase [Rasiella rasia]
MNEALLHTDVQEFIFQYEEDLSKLAFAGSKFPAVSTQELLEQLQSRRAIKKKLPLWYHKMGVIYPPKLNLEQTSSEITAQYKAKLCSGTSLADLTGGFGVDTFYFSRRFQEVAHFEINKSLSEIASHNFNLLGQSNISCHTVDGLQGVTESEFDVLYIDPSRRNESKGKVFLLEDCEPNVPKHLQFLLSRSKTILIKTSPMLDISVGIKELEKVTEIHVVAVNNEVKELLWLIDERADTNPKIITANVTTDGPAIFSFNHKASFNTTYKNPQKFLYEPNAAILKAGGFQYISEHYAVAKLHQHSHLFTNQSLIEFPGRRFRIEKILPYTKKDMRRGITFDTANITTRNFPESVATLRKKWKIKEGGERYLFFTTLENEDKILLICAKV